MNDRYWGNFPSKFESSSYTFYHIWSFPHHNQFQPSVQSTELSSLISLINFWYTNQEWMTWLTREKGETKNSGISKESYSLITGLLSFSDYLSPYPIMAVWIQILAFLEPILVVSVMNNACLIHFSIKDKLSKERERERVTLSIFIFLLTFLVLSYSLIPVL